MDRLCGAKDRNNNHRPCSNPAMENGRCRIHGGLSTGPKTDAGRRSISLANTKTGIHSKKAEEEKRRAKKLVAETNDFLITIRSMSN